MALGNIGNEGLLFPKDPFSAGSKILSDSENTAREDIAMFGKGEAKGSVGIEGERKAGASEETGHAGKDKEHTVKDGYRSAPAECETCKTRKYQDGSDENVSFKAASHISPEEAPARVRGHEGEHVSNAYSKAAEKGGKVIAANVAIHTAICPECGRTYVSGGTTSTVISYPKDGKKKADEAMEAAKQKDTDGARDKTAVENFSV